MARPRKEKTEIETALQVTPARRRRKKVVEVTRGEHEAMAVQSSELAMVEHGVDPEDVDFRKVQIFAMNKLLGIARGRAAELLGLSKMEGTRVYDRLRQNPAFREKCNAFLEKVRSNYQDAVAARLPDIAELDSLTLKQYRDNPQLLVDKPSALKHLRQVAAVQAPDGVTMQTNVQINLESLQALIQKDVSD
jgi:hypothetical protein